MSGLECSKFRDSYETLLRYGSNSVYINILERMQNNGRGRREERSGETGRDFAARVSNDKNNGNITRRMAVR